MLRVPRSKRRWFVSSARPDVRPRNVSRTNSWSRRLFDDCVGDGQQTARHHEPERSRGLEVDRHFVLDRRLYREVGWARALEDAIDVAGRQLILGARLGAVGDQAALARPTDVEIKRRQAVLHGARDDLGAM